ncbi:hypothetical protein BOS5A_200795 [Bosea sp. EC-HK365B]|nr:hypothetical protein BOS5A_200795 [Bosea sp. EC-HK365B]
MRCWRAAMRARSLDAQESHASEPRCPRHDRDNRPRRSLLGALAMARLLGRDDGSRLPALALLGARRLWRSDRTVGRPILRWKTSAAAAGEAAGRHRRTSGLRR